MRKTVRWILIGLASLVAVVVVVAGILHFVGSSRLNNAPDVTLKSVTVPSDATSVQRGEYLATLSSCNGCHGDNLGGEVMIDGAPIGYVPAPNLTGGAGGIGGDYSADDWAAAIRHGVARDGRSLIIMPAYHYDRYGDEDLGALIAYLQTLTPVDNELEPRKITFPGTIIFGLLAYNDIAAVAQIDHDAVGQAPPPAGETAAYGEYLVQIASCGSCHGENLAGNPGGSDSPAGPNITQGGELQSWSQDDFDTAMRTGMTPDSRQLSDEMPWWNFAQLSDADLAAIWAYLNEVPALPTNPR